MPITFNSYVDWSGFQPGSMYPSSRDTYDHRKAWAWAIPDQSQTTLIPAVLSVLERPEVDEWQQEVSTIEWKTLAPIWGTVAEQLLINDPVFKAFQSPWYVTADGKWTDQFRKHPTFDVLREELVIRMQEEFEYNAKWLQSIYNGSPKAAAVDADDAATPPRDDEFQIEGWGWLKHAYTAVKVGRIFSPAGIGWIAVEYAAKYGYHKYQERQERQERERQRQERRERHRQGRRNYDQLAEVTLPDGEWAETLSQNIKGFSPDAPSIGLFAVEAPSAQYKWTKAFGSPAALVSQDGVYL